MFKKIIVILTVIFIFLTSVINVFAYSIIDINIGVQTSTQTLGSGSKITAIDNRAQTIENQQNGTSVTLTFSDTGTSTHCGLATAVFIVRFPDSSYVQGQTYNFSFTLNGSQSNNDTLVYIPNSYYYTTNFLGLELVENWYKVGDTVPQWSNVLDKISGVAGTEDTEREPVVYETAKLYNNSKMSVDISIPYNYVENLYTIGGTLLNSYPNQLTVCVLMRTNYRGTTITMNDISITPTGSTKALYAEYEHNEQVEEGLSDINDSLDEMLTLPQAEADFADSSGNDAVDGIMGGIENKGTGFFNSLGNLISAMSYSGTDCKWQFPALYIPEIEGVIDRTALTSELDIDFEYWIDEIPQNIMSVVRAVLTIALIIFCFKELYGILSYVFTLKGG